MRLFIDLPQPCLPWPAVLQDNDFTTRAEKLFLGGDRERVLEMLQRDTKLLQSCKLMDYSLLVAIHSYDGVSVRACAHARALARVGGEKGGGIRWAYTIARGQFLPFFCASQLSKPLCSRVQPSIPVSRPCPQEVPALDRELHRTCFGDGSHNSLYFVGLIDGLTNYSAKKRAAHAAKTAKHGVRVRGGDRSHGPFSFRAALGPAPVLTLLPLTFVPHTEGGIFNREPRAVRAAARRVYREQLGLRF